MTFAPATDPNTFVIYFTEHGTQKFPFLGFQIISEHHDDCGWIIKKVPMSFGDDGDDEYAMFRDGVYYFDEQEFKTEEELKLYRDVTKNT